MRLKFFALRSLSPFLLKDSCYVTIHFATQDSERVHAMKFGLGVHITGSFLHVMSSLWIGEPGLNLSLKTFNAFS